MTGIVGSAEIPAELPAADDRRRHFEVAVRPLFSTCRPVTYSLLCYPCFPTYSAVTDACSPPFFGLRLPDQSQASYLGSLFFIVIQVLCFVVGIRLGLLRLEVGASSSFVCANLV
jgi:hypothetical protein